jgi:hypothetical protein
MDKTNKENVKIKPKILLCTPISDIEPRDMSWLWKDRIPEYHLTILEGDGGRGKSTIVTDLCARLSNGIELPDDLTFRDPKQILLFSKEDDKHVVLRPRIEKHGADLKNISVNTDDNFFLNQKGLRDLRETITSNSLDLVVFDPIVSYLEAKVDMNSGNEVRAVLGPLSSMARETNCTIIVVRHFNKSSGGKAAHRGSGSVDFRNAARSVLQTIYCEHDQRTYLALEKTNYGVRPKTLPVNIIDGKIEWGDPCDISAEELHLDENSTGPTKVKEAMEFLNDLLEKPMARNEVYKLAKENHIAEKTLERASKKLRVRKNKIDKQSVWSLPTPPKEDAQLSQPGHLNGP